MIAAASMDGLYDLITKNKHLRYLDVNGMEYTALDLLGEELPLPNERGLAFLYLDNSVTAVSALVNFLKEKWVLALLSPKLDGAFKEQLEALYCPAIIYDHTRSDKSGYEKYKWQKATLFVSRKPKPYLLHQDLKILLSTSGSTGSPKFVKLSEKNLIQNAYAILDYLPIKATDVTPLNLPLYYSYGLSIFTTNAIAGAKLVCTNSDVMQKEFWNEWDRFQYTSLAGVPYIYEMLMRLGFLKKQYPSLRYLTQAGGKLNKNLLEQYALYAAENGIDYYVMYGQTEATARMAFLPPEKLLDKLGAIGKPIKNGTFHLDEATGELLYAGPNVHGGYANGPKDLAHFEQPEYLRTGDLAMRDDEGFYYITGRMKRIVKLFGIRINLDEIEQLLKNNFSQANFICLGVEDKYIVVVCVKHEMADEAIKEVLHKKVHIHPNVLKIYSINDVTLTANGKIDYNATGELLGLPL
ncbi:Acyl-CoA synthetase (AMP-forming)/AMP-acid ligase II [Olivibacter domesticus]|uniref:Acyl-CoA synthetase (AMP-forming)/AMP-acid ligase II n=2 Tax=Olivibacter domesticus TaxID=407022 RepID=A0A1H7MTX0_OLID1|nr:Acyl-CoA synthetase (AMP-forming)/AMP-acid ligase II [Olivibacter domesticus]